MSKGGSVFISYAQADSIFARDLARTLEHTGLSVFYDNHALRPDQDLAKQVTASLARANVVVVLLSRDTKNSHIVKHEVASALEENESRAIIPVLLDSEGRDNWVWPLVADKAFIEGRDVSSVQRAILRALDSKGARGRRSRWLGTFVVLAILAILTMFFTLASRGRTGVAPQRFGLQLAVRGEPSRGSGPLAGDELIVNAYASDRLLVYREDRLIVECPNSPSCIAIGHGWQTTVTLIPGTYRILQAAGAGDTVLTGNLDSDVAELHRKGFKLNAVPLNVP